MKSAVGGGGHVVVIGGGAGGATAAKYIRKMDPSIKVTLINDSAKHTTCYMSNWILAGIRDLDSITHNYDTLASKYDIKVVIDTATEIDTAAKKVKTKGGQTMVYDRCIVSPGISFKWDTIEDYDEDTSRIVPHAWTAGPHADRAAVIVAGCAVKHIVEWCSYDRICHVTHPETGGTEICI